MSNNEISKMKCCSYCSYNYPPDIQSNSECNFPWFDFPDFSDSDCEFIIPPCFDDDEIMKIKGE